MEDFKEPAFKSLRSPYPLKVTHSGLRTSATRLRRKKSKLISSAFEKSWVDTVWRGSAKCAFDLLALQMRRNKGDRCFLLLLVYCFPCESRSVSGCATDQHTATTCRLCTPPPLLQFHFKLKLFIQWVKITVYCRQKGKNLIVRTNFIVVIVSKQNKTPSVSNGGTQRHISPAFQ